MERELTTKEKREVKQLVTNQCANYDKAVGCMLLDDTCPMLLKSYNNCCVCKYFRTSVLPLNESLQAVFEKFTLKKCKNCGTKFRVSGRKVYCSEKCTKEVAKKQSKERMRKLREK